MRLALSVVTIAITLALIGPASLAQGGRAPAAAGASPDTLTWEVPGEYGSAVLTVVGPDGAPRQFAFAAGQPLALTLTGGNWPDGAYSYELALVPAVLKVRAEADAAGAAAPEASSLPTLAGHFVVLAGALIADEGVVESAGAALRDVQLQDQVVADDMIVQSSLCIGFDCVNGESFGFDTVRLKENNLRIAFNDTSSTGGFPTNDWQIVANDSASGGNNYLAFQDVDHATFPFQVLAGARSNALTVASTSRVGLGTGVPLLKLHLVQGDTPAIRLDQDASGGFTPYTWDIGGNEANFFVRDMTAGTRLPLRIFPGAASNSLVVHSTGVGLGTTAPQAALHVSRTGANAEARVQRTDGATGGLTAQAGAVTVGATSNHPLRVLVNGQTVAEFDTSGRLVMTKTGGATAVFAPQTDQVNIGTLSSHPLVFKVGANAVARLDANGNLTLKGTVTENSGAFGGELGGVAAKSLAAEVAAQPSSASVMALNEQVAEQEARIEQLEAQNRALAERLAELEALVRSQGAPAR